ncbi:WS/DGAT/MGAT family O-acyltransferase [Haliea sp. E17]|uniref:WS/DGAT/MGAT family O-acyltransferase n=1 Tax=Haliea sp. E17 TaxID=3401576 RepID=UPI003AAE7600
MPYERVSLSDASWLLMESRERPMHVATLLIYSLPDNAGDDYLGNLVRDLRGSTEFADPFNRRLVDNSLRLMTPMWTRDYDLDMEFHVRHQALPQPGGERELGMLISRLHSNPMDFSRPLWEYHVIEGLDDNRWAVYFKMHHSMVDGIAGIRMLQRSMSADPEETGTPALWSAHPPVEEHARASHSPLALLRTAAHTVGSVVGVGRGLLSIVRAARDRDDPAKLPFQTPVSILNHRIHSQRRFATQQYEFERIRKLSKQAGCTVNDIILALCSGALRRFLKELGALPGRALTAGIPVSLRAKDDEGAGSAVSFIIADLATNIADPQRRLKSISSSTRRAKALMSDMPRDTIERYTAAVMTPYSLQMLAGLEGRTRPVFNVTISNVPGPTEPLYFRGSRLEAMYPVSAVTHGQALNITCYSYAGTLTFGFAGCRDTLPHMQRLAVYTGEALEELEQVFSRANKSGGKAKTLSAVVPKRERSTASS